MSSNLIARSTGSAIVPTLLTAKWLNAEVAQSVEHSTENAGVPSSSLGLGTKLMVDCQLLIVDGGTSAINN